MAHLRYWSSLIGFSLAGVCLLLLFFISVQRKEPTEQSPSTPKNITANLLVPVKKSTDPMKGSPKAPITIVEFADFSCEHCATLSPIFEQILAEFPNDVALIWKDLPEPIVGLDTTMPHQAAACAQEQNKFWEYHDALFTNQGILGDENTFSAIAETLELDKKQFEECLQNKKYASQIQLDIEEGKQLGITATPYLFMQGIPYNGETTLEALTEKIQSIKSAL